MNTGQETVLRMAAGKVRPATEPIEPAPRRAEDCERISQKWCLSVPCAVFPSRPDARHDAGGQGDDIYPKSSHIRFYLQVVRSARRGKRKMLAAAGSEAVRRASTQAVMRASLHPAHSPPSRCLPQ